ncbi:hypothetical protein YC2023_023407 [Brassica napus]
MEKRGCGFGNVAISCVYLAIVLLLLSSALATSSQVTPPTTGQSCCFVFLLLVPNFSYRFEASLVVTPPNIIQINFYFKGRHGGKWGVRTLMQYGEGDGEGDDGSTYHSRCKRGDVTGSCTRGDGIGNTKT